MIKKRTRLVVEFLFLFFFFFVVVAINEVYYKRGCTKQGLLYTFVH